MHLLKCHCAGSNRCLITRHVVICFLSVLCIVQKYVSKYLPSSYTAKYLQFNRRKLAIHFPHILKHETIPKHFLYPHWRDNKAGLIIPHQRQVVMQSPQRRLHARRCSYNCSDTVTDNEIAIIKNAA